ncbi:MAG: zinc ribbon domain-containing protein [Pyrinomonadaceae bacterium]
MYCPRCGQEQTSENIRFCSRCGFLLETVAEVLANGGVLPQLLELKEKKTLLTRKNGIVFSLYWFIFFVLILTSLFGIMDVNTLPAMSAIIGVFGALMWLIASFIFLKKPSANFFQELPARHQNLSGTARNTLPPPQSQPVESYVAPVNNWKTPPTGEVARPPSVTEETTKLLQKDE